MDNFHKTATGIIITKLKKTLDRELTIIENEVFSMPRSGIAYEMMDDYITDQRKTKKDIEEYVKAVVNEYLQMTNKG